MRLFPFLLSAAATVYGSDCAPSRLGPQETLTKFQELDRAAQTAMDRGQYGVAARHYREAACLEPASARAFFRLGTAEAAAGAFPAARAAFQTASTLLPASPMPLAMLVRVGVSMRDTAGVKETLRRAAERFPHDAELHSGLARFLAESKLLDLALAESLRADQAGAKDAESTAALAALENTAGAYEDAIRHGLAVENMAGVADAVKASAAGVTGLSYESVGQRAEAVRHLKLAAQLAPARENSWLALAFVLEKAQRHAEAVDALEQARRQIPSSTSFLLPLGNNLIWAERFQAGVDILKELIRLSPKTAEAYLRLAEAYRKTGRPELEIQTLQELGRVEPDYPMIHVLTAQAMLTLNPADYTKVLSELAAGGKIAPGDPEIFYLRGKAYLAMGRSQDAAAALRRSIEQRPMEPGAYYQLALAYRRLGQTALAREVLERMEHVKQGAGTR